MGLVPSRSALHEAATSSDRPLPYISRPVESYVYTTNRTERTLGSGVPGFITGLTPLPAALPETTMAVLHGAPALDLAQKLSNELPDAVFVDDPAEASAAVAAMMAANRSGKHGVAGQRVKAQREGGAAESGAAAQALRMGKAPFVYYYEHRVLPLTKDFFPSPDCLLFRQLWHARQHQNPRYHFQLAETWSPGALMDPTAHYDSFLQLAAHSMTDVEAACLTASGTTPTRGSVLQAEAELAAAKLELRAAEAASGSSNSGSGRGKPAQSSLSQLPVPFATREEFYNLVVRTTEESMLYESDDAVRAAVQDAAEGRSNVTASAAAAPSRLRPVPCAIVLVRRCMSAQQYRYTYYVANHERHHRNSERENPRRDVQTIGVTGGAVRVAVEEDEEKAKQRSRNSKAAPTATAGGKEAQADEEEGEEPLMVPWLQVSVPQAPLDLAEVRVVGMYGCWTMEEILRHSLFLPSTTPTSSNNSDGSRDAEVKARMDAVLRRACPHGVPSSTLLNVGFFEKQVGDKEQCHTYFSLCRLFAHGMRACLLRDVMSASSASALTCTFGGDDVGDDVVDGDVEQERAEMELKELRRQQAHPLWQRFLRVVAAGSEGSAGASAFADFANCFLIRFSNVPQLQLCRQLRLLLTGMAGVYPEPIALEAFQAAQRQRNMIAMAKKQPQPEMSATSTVAAVGVEGDERGSRTGAATASAAVNAVTGPNSTQRPRPSLDPAAIAEHHQEQHGELHKLRRDGFCCYASDGLVVFRMSRACVARALSQLGFASLKDSIEALCVTLTAAAPPPLTYRGELRPPLATTTAAADAGVGRQLAVAVRGENEDGDEVNVGEEELCDVDSGNVSGPLGASSPAVGGAAGDETNNSSAANASGSEGFTLAAVRDLYCNAIRYSSDATTGFAALRLSSCTSTTTTTTTETPALLKVDPLEATADDKIGVLPRNPVEQRRGRLLPLRRALLHESRANTPSAGLDAAAGAAGGGGTHDVAAAAAAAAKAALATEQQQHFDVYTVSEELDGVALRQLVELTHHVEHRRHTRSGGADADWPAVFIEAVDAQGNAEPDSVLNWSPMAALGERVNRLGNDNNTAASAGGEDAGECVAPHSEADNGGESTTPVHLSQTLHSATSLRSSLSGSRLTPGAVPIRVHDPDRILHTGDRIRYAPPQGGVLSPSGGGGGYVRAGESSSPSPTSAELPSPRQQQQQPSPPMSTSPKQRCRRAAAATTTTRHGYWYVDDTLTTEDLVLSWMRRVGGRARETRGHDTKWVRYPTPILTALLQFARLCRQRPSGGWLSTTVPLRLLHPMDDELVEPDMLQNFPDIVRTRRFRQWRFSHDGYVYFHGVTVRMPGTALPIQAAAAAAVAAAATAAATQSPPPPSSTTAGIQASQGRPMETRESRAPPAKGVVKTAAPRSAQTHAGTTTDAAPSAAGKQTPLTIQQQQQQHPQQQQHKRPNTFAGVPRPPPVMQRSAYDNQPSAQAEGVYYSSQPNPVSQYPYHVPFQLGGTPPQQQQQQQQQGGYEGAAYLPSTQQQQTYVYPAQSVQQQQMQLQQPQRTSVTMYVPVTYSVEPYYIPQAPVNVPAATVPTSPLPYPNTLYFNESEVMNPRARGPSGSVSHAEGSVSGVGGGVAAGAASSSFRSPGGGSQQMHFSLHHMDSASSLRSYDRTASNAMMGPTHVTGSFYGDLYGQSPQLPPAQPSTQMTSPGSASVQSGAEYRGGDAWQGNNTTTGAVTASYGTQTPDGSAFTTTPKPHDTSLPYSTYSGGPGNLSGAGPQQQHQQQQRYESAFSATAVDRRSTADYPPRRIGASFLASGGAGTGTAAATAAGMVAHPTVQRAVSRPIQTAHVDPAKREIAAISGESGVPLRLPIPKSRMQPANSAAAATAQTPLTPIEQQQLLQRQQQQQQHQQAPAIGSPHLSSAAGSFRDGALTADVIETDGITVHVMQRKPSMSVRRAVVSPHSMAHPSSLYSGGGGAAAAAASAADERAYYGATGMSPTGGWDAAAASSFSAATHAGHAAEEDGRGVQTQQVAYEMPAALSPTTTTSRATSFAISGGTVPGAGARSLSRGATVSVGGTAPGAAGVATITTPPSLQRQRSQRVSHNPYATRDVNILHGGTPVLGPASPSYHSHSGTADVAGGYEAHRGPSGHDAFQAALDAQYGSEHDFNPTGASARSNFATRQSAMQHGVLYGRSTTSITTDTQEKHSSFYAAPEGEAEPQQSYSTHEMYRDKIADGTTQGFYYSMDGPDDDDDGGCGGGGGEGGAGNAAQQLYGRDIGAGYGGQQRQERAGYGHGGGAPHANIPAPPTLQRTQHSSYRNAQ